jgi:hypothetical protein
MLLYDVARETVTEPQSAATDIPVTGNEPPDRVPCFQFVLRIII